MQLHQALMLTGILIMASGGFGVMLALYKVGKLQQQAEDPDNPVDPDKLQKSFFVQSILQKVFAVLFFIGFLLMSVAASLR